jgi:hypothetical protein
MIKKRIKEIRTYVFGEEENFPLEHRLFLSAIVVGILVSIFQILFLPLHQLQ